MSNGAEQLANELTDRQVRLLATVSAAMAGEPVRLSLEEWCEAEQLFESLEDQR